MGKIPAGGTLIYDTVFVKEKPGREDIAMYRFPITKLADDAGLRRSANIVALGVLSRATGIVSPEALAKAVRARSPGKSATLNLKALELGLGVDAQAGRVQ
jgi:2-oxoglutarate ferredoxin oxidoreductase subunit gamma